MFCCGLAYVNFTHVLQGYFSGRGQSYDLRSLQSLQWRHNGCDGVSNHQPQDCLLTRLFRCRSKKISKLRVTGFVRGIHRWPVNYPHKWPVTRKMLPFHDVIMYHRAPRTGFGQMYRKIHPEPKSNARTNTIQTRAFLNYKHYGVVTLMLDRPLDCWFKSFSRRTTGKPSKVYMTGLQQTHYTIMTSLLHQNDIILT